ncbi:peptide ABC transporter substrate-binding protein [Patescibacteria group bacterium]|nr:MAG: peptide ABC transporter substrate-binding protein [Patescibacteria group bacterium]
MPDEESQWKKFVRIKSPSVKHVRVRARKIEGATFRHAHRFIISRFANLRDVRRHAFGWLILAGLLVLATGVQLLWVQRSLSSQQPVAGGVYAEGVIGRIDTLNPVYAMTQSERSASHLIFSGLFRYDASNNLAGDLGETWRQSEDGRVYTVSLRKDAQWHDGEKVTADDVVYTLGLIKNPQTRSYLYRTWQDVSVKAVDRYTLEFTLPSAYAPFPHALTFGVLPKHLLGKVSPLRLREHTFNREPIGSGPFRFTNTRAINPDMERAVIQLERNDNYYRGPVKLERFQIYTYKDHDDLRQGFLSREINAASELTSEDIDMIIEEQPTTVVGDARLNDGVYAFFQTDQPVVKDVAIRKALLLATDRTALRGALGGKSSSLHGPLLVEQTASAHGKKQAAYDAVAAGRMLDEAGWSLEGNIRQKDGQKLQLNVVAPDVGDFPVVLKEIVKQWRALGVDVKDQVVPTATFEQNVLASRAYDVLLYELALGADPDVFAYWHSSQSSVRGFNLSNYRSDIADDALMSARGKSDLQLRDAKYSGFIDQWLTDTPAIALYQPHLRYVTTDGVRSVHGSASVVDALGRYHTIDQWTVLQAERNKTP